MCVECNFLNPSSAIDKLPILLLEAVTLHLSMSSVRQGVTTENLCLPDAPLWLGLSDIDSIPSIDLQRKQERAHGETAARL